MKMGMFNLSLFSGSGEQLAEVYYLLLMHAMQICNRIEID